MTRSRQAVFDEDRMNKLMRSAIDQNLLCRSIIARLVAVMPSCEGSAF
jgi:hypothetical protein